jgi:adenylosuccinate synthase
MPVSVVVGGQYGSEGKGKTSLHIARTDSTTEAVIRVGGSNSGHTGIARDGSAIALRQLPAGAIDGYLKVLLPAGSYIDVAQLLQEIELLDYDPRLIRISPFAHVITEQHRQWERDNSLRDTIGSTQSGTGAAVLSRIARGAPSLPMAVRAEDVAQLTPLLGDTTDEARSILDRGGRIIVEGTQGFGLSAIHAEAWPKATSRDTTAAGFISESGLSPLDVDDVTMVLRCHPIRVAGCQSGPLPYETSWAQIAREAGIERDLTELTTVTRLERRVGHFDADIVRQAIAVNWPTRIVLNHLDYIAPEVATGTMSEHASQFVTSVADGIGRHIDWIGTSPGTIVNLSGNLVIQA